MVKQIIFSFLIIIVYCDENDSLLKQLNKNITTLIINGLVVTGEESTNSFIGHVLINMYGKIHSIVKGGKEEAEDLIKQFPKAEVVDAANKIVFPGGIDPSVHLDYLQGQYQFQTSDDFFTGSIAALFGGTTTFIDYTEANVEEREELIDSIYERMENAEQDSLIDFTFHLTVNQMKYERNLTSSELHKVLYNFGINTFKFDTYHDREKLNDTGILDAFKILRTIGGLAIMNCEDEEIIHQREKKCEFEGKYKVEYLPYCHPPESERKSLEKILNLEKKVNFPQGVHFLHVSSKESISLIEEAKKKKIKVTAEVTPHHLILTDKVYEDQSGLDYLTSPPLRREEDVEALWEAIQNDVIDFISSEHSPFTYEQRRGKRTKPDYRLTYQRNGKFTKIYDNAREKWWEDKKIPFYKAPKGVSGIETRLLLIYHFGVVKKRISIEKFVELISTNAAKRYGLFPKKGFLGKGADADIVILDPDEKTVISAETLHQNCDITPYEGMTLNGKIKTVFVNGKKMIDNSELLPSALSCRGHFLFRTHYFLGNISED